MAADKDAVYGAIGLANRAGCVISGQDLCLKAVRNGKAEMIIVSVEASDNTKKRFRNACKSNEVMYTEYGTGNMLGKMTGRDYRMVLGIKDKNFSKLIITKLQYERELVNEQKSK